MESSFPGFGMRPFGRTKAMVSPIAMAGTTLGINDPPVEVYRHGFERGINLFFWDSSFKNMTTALLELSSDERSKLFIIAINAGGGPRQIRKGLHKKLKILKLEKFGSYLLGWVRSKYRVRQSVLDELVSIREDGLCDNIGLSIHKRKMAYDLSTKNIFDIFMVRYNAAHRGLEDDFLNKLNPENRPAVLTYTTTRWGKLLKRPPNWEDNLPRPGDLYRFALSYPLVDSVCMSIHNIDQLDSNLEVLSEGVLKPDEDTFIRRFGDVVYQMKTPLFGNLYEKSDKI
ncbi:MAG: hypothetical protein V3W18_08845 [candidate division Zixibacteria bacterium]